MRVLSLDAIDDLPKPTPFYKKQYRFFFAPCFACENMSFEMDGDYCEHQWQTCRLEYEAKGERERHLYELMLAGSGSFPEREAPKRCIRKGHWKIARGNEWDADFFDALYCVSPFYPDYDDPALGGLANDVAYSVADFNQRMRNIGRRTSS